MVARLRLLALAAVLSASASGCGPAPLDVISLGPSDSEGTPPACAVRGGCNGAISFAAPELQVLEPFGDKGGTPAERGCPLGDVAIGLVARVSPWRQSEGCSSDARWLTRVGLQCAHASATGTLVTLEPLVATMTVGAGGDCGDTLTDTVICPPEQVLVGYAGYTRQFDNFSKPSGITLYCAAVTVAADGSSSLNAPQVGPTVGVMGDVSSPPQLCAEGAVTGLASTAGVVVDSLWFQCRRPTTCALGLACE